MLLVVLLSADAPEVRTHGLCAGSGVFLRKEGFLVGNDLAQVDLARPYHRCYRGETLACLQFLGGRLGAALAMNGSVLQSGGFHVVVNGAKFLRDLARDMVNRVFKNNFSPERSPNGMGECSFYGRNDAPAIPTVQSQKSLGFSMPKRERYRAAFSKRLQLPRRNHNKRCRLADGATGKNILRDNIPRKKTACSMVEQAGVRQIELLGN